MARQRSMNHYSDSESSQGSGMQDLDDPFCDFNHDAVFFETIKTFKPKTTFERELVKGVMHRRGKVPEVHAH